MKRVAAFLAVAVLTVTVGASESAPMWQGRGYL
jgi:hypothetical protein